MFVTCTEPGCMTCLKGVRENSHSCVYIDSHTHKTRTLKQIRYTKIIKRIRIYTPQYVSIHLHAYTFCKLNLYFE